MKLKYRIVLTTFLILIFMVISPIVLLYASGYRYDFNSYRIVKTGLLSIKTEPRGATVYIDGEPLESQTPTKIGDLLPETYEIRIEKDGYHPWSKELQVESQLATFAENIHLYRSDLDIQSIFDTPIYDAVMREQTAYTISKSEENFVLQYIDLNSNESKNILMTESLPKYKVSPDFQSIAYLDNGDLILHDTQNNVSLNVHDVIESTSVFTLDQMAWDKSNAQIAYISFKGLLYKIDILNKTADPVHELLADTFVVHDHLIVYLSHTKTNSYLTAIDYLNENTPPFTLAKLPKTDSYEFNQYENDLIGLLDHQNNLLFLVDIENQEIKPILESMFDVKDAKWHGDDFIYFNDFEIWTWNKANDQRNLINRFSSSVSDALILPNEDILFAFEKDVFVIEPDKRDHQNMTKLLSFDEIFQLSVNKKGDTLYLFAKQDNQLGLFKVEIQ